MIAAFISRQFSESNRPSTHTNNGRNHGGAEISSDLFRAWCGISNSPRNAFGIR